ncbi:endonuclease/exonuclease/phosphatase family protein [Brevibacterium sp. CSND-B09]|uniref:endonuclease/exonuclease/phosphatase family protein n=1 Tax=Brevibacterium sp. CSND-B09 TaxID=3462571 RepID=UPI00406A0FBE
MDLHFWNTDRLSACDAKARRRFVRAMGFAASGHPDVIRLSEVSNTALKHLDRFADDHGYRLVHRSRDDVRIHVALMISDEHQVVARNVFTSIDESDGTLDSEVVIATVEDGTGSIFSIAAVYNYSSWPHVLTDAQDFTDRHSEGRLVIGGDFNMARMLDDDKELQHLGSVAFDRINHDLGWVEVSPGSAEDEVPTWPVGPSAGNRPRQLDHVFVKGLDEFSVECSVIIPPEEDVRLSDHALLRTHLAHRAPRHSGGEIGETRAEVIRSSSRSVLSAR